MRVVTRFHIFDWIQILSIWMIKFKKTNAPFILEFSLVFIIIFWFFFQKVQFKIQKLVNLKIGKVQIRWFFVGTCLVRGFKSRQKVRIFAKIQRIRTVSTSKVSEFFIWYFWKVFKILENYDKKLEQIQISKWNNWSNHCSLT